MNEDVVSTRRGFLKTAGLGVSALCLQLEAVQSAFAADLGKSPLKSESDLPFANLYQQYGLGQGVTYLNHASVGTIPRAVQKAQRGYLELCETNPWLHMWGEAWQEPRERVRHRAALWLGCELSEVTLSHNTTETFNLLAQGLPLGPGDEVLFSNLNHAGASVCWSHAAEVRGFKVREFEFPVLDVHGMTSEDIVALYTKAIRPETRVLVLPHVDNVVGLRHPVREIAAAARRLGVEFVAVDAAQSVGMFPVNAKALGVDVYASSAHKWLQAPKGLGLAYIREEVQERLRPVWVTWGQKSWHGSARKYEDYGTRNFAEVLTLGDALLFQEALGAESLVTHHKRLRSFAKDRVEAEPGLTWHSPNDWELGSAIYSIGVKGAKSSVLFRRIFEEHGFVFRPFEVHGLNAVRISPNALNSTDELSQLLDLLVSSS